MGRRSLGDAWQNVPTAVARGPGAWQDAAPRLPEPGPAELHCFAAFPQHHYIARLIEAPQQTALPHGLVLLQQRGPFDTDAELRLLR